MKRQFIKMLYVVVAVLLIIQLSGCGYLLYPERRGQKTYGRIDPGVAILDALGLLVFIVPGVIAFAVDVTNGTLYFPPGRRRSSVPSEVEQMTVIRVNPAELNEKMIQDMVKVNTGISIDPDLRNIEIYELDRSEDIQAKLIELKNSGYRKD
jgi:hypothetical protein